LQAIDVYQDRGGWESLVHRPESTLPFTLYHPPARVVGGKGLTSDVFHYRVKRGGCHCTEIACTR
jgi:hypothetical protein